MNKWYRKAIVKASVLILGILSGAVFITSLAVMTALSGSLNPSQIMKVSRASYEDSKAFSQSVENYMVEVLNKSRLKQIFEMDGAYNPSKIIDVMDYYEEELLDGDNHSGIAYKLEDLVEWSKEYQEGNADQYAENAVVVCQRQDGSYYYYDLNEFLSMFTNRQMFIKFENDTNNQESFLQSIRSGDMPTNWISGDMSICDVNGNEIYTDCWNFGRSLKERYTPDGAKSILEVVNERPEFNGKLTVVYDKLTSVLTSISSDFNTYESGWGYLEEGNTNFTYLYVDMEAQKIITNKKEFERFNDLANNIEQMKSGESVKYMFVYPKLQDFQTNMDISASAEWSIVKMYEKDPNFNAIFALSVDTTYPIQDQFYEGKEIYNSNIPLLRGSLIAIFLSGFSLLIAAVWLGVTAGMRPADEEIHLTGFDRWKTELAAVFIVGVWGLVTVIALTVLDVTSLEEGLETLGHYSANFSAEMPEMYSKIFTQSLSLFDMTGVFLYALVIFICFFCGYMTLIRRIKGKILWKGSLLYAILSFGGELLRERTVVFKSAVLVIVVLLLNGLSIVNPNVIFLPLTILSDCFAAWYVLRGAIAKDHIKKGIEQIALGNLEYRIDLSGLRGTDLELAKQVNEIGSGLNRAIDEAMRNERLKTDLITNVSHDIKTPLTSIINYVDILKRSDIADEKIQGYLDILEAKAQRLKTLTEDVVEASKVSSGNINLEYMDVDFREMVQQTEGEMAEKFAARNLTVVLNLPEEPAIVHVDGRRMWRVLENIFGNAAKYAMPGTRVYADLLLAQEEVQFTLKNMSEQQLNISADELTERFIRGDISRSTEGSGLGLSIAKSLTTMQGGRFELYLDGDLFKVDIHFPRQASHRDVEPEENEQEASESNL